MVDGSEVAERLCNPSKVESYIRLHKRLEHGRNIYYKCQE